MAREISDREYEFGDHAQLCQCVLCDLMGGELSEEHPDFPYGGDAAVEAVLGSAQSGLWVKRTQAPVATVSGSNPVPPANPDDGFFDDWDGHRRIA